MARTWRILSVWRKYWLLINCILVHICPHSKLTYCKDPYTYTKYQNIWSFNYTLWGGGGTILIIKFGQSTLFKWIHYYLPRAKARVNAGVISNRWVTQRYLPRWYTRVVYCYLTWVIHLEYFYGHLRPFVILIDNYNR